MEGLAEQLAGLSCYDSSPFEGIVVTGTGFRGQQRKQIRQVCEAAGIAYVGDLQRGTTTHLVVSGNPHLANPEKVARAHQWGIPCVALLWLLDSVSEGYCQPTEGPYAAALEQRVTAKPADNCKDTSRPKKTVSSVASNRHLEATAAFSFPVLGQLAISRHQQCPFSPVDANVNTKNGRHNGANVHCPAQGLTPSPLEAAHPEANLDWRSLSMQALPALEAATPSGAINSGSDWTEEEEGPQSGKSSMRVSGGSALRSSGNAGAVDSPDSLELSAGSPMIDSPCLMPTIFVHGMPDGTPDGTQPVQPDNDAACTGRPRLPSFADSTSWAPKTGSSRKFDDPQSEQQPESTLPLEVHCSPADLDDWSDYGKPDEDNGGWMTHEFRQDDGSQVSEPLAPSPSHSGSILQDENENEVDEDQRSLEGNSQGSGPAQQSDSPISARSWRPRRAEYFSDGQDTPSPLAPDLQGGASDSPIVVSRPKPAYMVTPTDAPSGEAAVPLQLLRRAPRGTTVKEAHGLRSLKGVIFADRIKLPALGLLLGLGKNGAACLRLRRGRWSGDAVAPNAAGSKTAGDVGDAMMAEPVAFYLLPKGHGPSSWQVEFHRLYGRAEAEAEARDGPLRLPPSFCRDSELLRGVLREHAPLSAVVGKALF
jgi:hypothetical protein